MPATEHKWSYVFNERTRILVVDDDPILREFASVYLSSPLSQVDSVGNANAALELLAREEFDIILVDIEMPGMDGIELVERMRAQDKLRAVPIVMITCREDITSIDRAYTAGATSFTTKPLNWRQLSYQLRYVIRASKSERVGAAAYPASSAMQQDLAASLGVIINMARRLASDTEQGPEALHARAIMATAESALRKLHGSASRNALPAPDQPRVA
jgi:DNA-binding response OmpR family regulator